jgi:hypothetical protein
MRPHQIDPRALRLGLLNTKHYLPTTMTPEEILASIDDGVDENSPLCKANRLLERCDGFLGALLHALAQKDKHESELFKRTKNLRDAIHQYRDE